MPDADQTSGIAAIRGMDGAFSKAVKLCAFIGTNVGGAVGWWLGEYIGVMTAFVMSGAGAIAGVYFGWRFARAYLS